MHLPVDSINAKPTNVPKELRPPGGGDVLLDSGVLVL